MMDQNPFGKNIWIAAAIFLFSIVYQQSGTYAYVDGDDAASLAYHIVGRDAAIQPAYSAYHGMMDKLLSLLPPQEELLKLVAFGTTRFANVLMFILIIMLVFDWLRTGKETRSPSWYLLASVSTLLAAPELFYFGLVYAPTFVAMCFILSAHLLFRWSSRSTNLTDRNRLLWYGVSIVLFGFGVAFRWNTVAYGIIIVVDLLTVLPATNPLGRRLWLVAGWGILALAFSFLTINLSGYGIDAFVKQAETALYVANQAGTLAPESSASLSEVMMRIGLTLTPLFTPLFALLILFGLIKLVKERSPLLFVIVAGVLSILPWFKSGVPKFMVTALPLFILAFVAGFDVVADFANRSRNKALVYILLLFALLIPWVVGIRVTRSGTAWGPGFEIKPYDYQEVSGMSFGMDFGPGMAFPTPEGPRPLYGHAYVLLGGWKNFVVARANEYIVAVDTALSRDVPLVSTGWSPAYYLNESYARGFQTTDPYERMSADGYFRERRFQNANGKKLAYLFTELDGSDITDLVHYLKNMEYQVIVLTGYSRTLRAFHENHPDAMQALGPNSAIIDLEKLRVE